MLYYGFSVTFDISIAIIALINIVVFIFYLCKKTKMKNSDFEIDECELGLKGGCIHLKCNNEHKQIAYKLWVDINTRVLAVKINLDEDNIRVINDSYYKCFTDTRDLLKEFPVTKLNSNCDLVNLIVRFLNEVMRPYLTKWGKSYSTWYDSEEKKDENRGKNPVEIQKKFPEYEELTTDLLSINEKVIYYSEKLKEIAFSINKARENKRRNNKND